MRFGKSLGLAGLALAGLLLCAPSSADETSKVTIRAVVTPPPGAPEATLLLEFIPANRDAAGNYVRPASGVENLTLSLAAGRPSELKFDLYANQEYQVRVDLLDASGNPDPASTYLFAHQDMVAKEFGTVDMMLVPGQKTALLLPLKWAPRQADKYNFLEVTAGPGGALQMTLYYNNYAVPLPS